MANEILRVLYRETPEQKAARLKKAADIKAGEFIGVGLLKSANFASVLGGDGLEAFYKPTIGGELVCDSSTLIERVVCKAGTNEVFHAINEAKRIARGSDLNGLRLPVLQRLNELRLVAQRVGTYVPVGSLAR